MERIHPRWLEYEREHRAAIEIDPTNSGAWCSLGAVLRKQSRLEEAKSAFEESLRLDPKDPHTLCRFGDFLTFSDLYMPMEAEKYLLRALEVEPDGPAETLAYLYWFIDRLDQADVYFQAALRSRPDSAVLKLDYIKLLSEIPGRRAEAETMIREKIESRSIAIYWNTLAIVLENQGRIKEALEAIEKALELAPDSTFGDRRDTATRLKAKLEE